MPTNLNLISSSLLFQNSESGLSKHHHKHVDKGSSPQSLQRSLKFYSSAQFTSAVTSYNNASNSQNSSQSNSVSTVTLSYSESSTSNSANGFKILDRELSSSLQSFKSHSSNHQSNIFKATQFSPPSAEDVALRILGFVENRLLAEKAQGASDEKLQSLLAQAREGIEKGFSQAKDQLEQLGMLNNTLSEEINSGYQSIEQGLSRLEKNYVDSELVTIPTAIVNNSDLHRDSSTLKSTHIRTASPSNPPAHINESSSYSHLYAYSESTAIQIQTQDGDIISINLGQIYASLNEGPQRYSSDPSHSLNQSNSTSTTYQSEHFNYSLEGELDEGEIAALTELLTQIKDLAEQFFGGDFMGAFESALSLGFDGSEIASFSLNLNITQVEQITTYEKISNFSPNLDQTNTPLALLSDFANDFSSLSSKLLNEFEHTQIKLTDLLSRMVDERIAFQSENETNDDKSLETKADELKSYLVHLLDQLS